jgi:outer membrane protein OmpA-like peptidoglycan-associated protein
LQPRLKDQSASQDDDPRKTSAQWQEVTVGATEIPTHFRFRASSADLDTRANRDIGRVVGLLSQPEYTEASLIVIGFSDTSGAADKNKELSLALPRWLFS